MRPALLAGAVALCCGGCAPFQALPEDADVTAAAVINQALPMAVTDVPVRMHYPPGTQTVDEAVSYLLEPHHYRPAPWGPEGEALAQRRFIKHFSAEPTPLRQALQRLLGVDGQIVLDRHRKRYAYRARAAHESGVVLADLGVGAAGEPAGMAAPAGTAPRQTPDQAAVQPPGAAPGGGVAVGGTPALPEGAPPEAGGLDAGAGDDTVMGWRVVAPTPVDPDAGGADARGRCRAIQFRERAMLSETVREYFRRCGFDEIAWRLGTPGRYADYRLKQDLTIPLPNAHEDLIELLRTRFGIRTLIHDDHRIEFHDEDSAP